MIEQTIVFILLIGVLIAVHEFGHFLLAKMCGVGVLKFSIGFGPALFRFRKGETDYQLSLIPLGGFVRMVGDMPDSLTGPQASDEAVRGNEVSPEKGSAELLAPEQEAMLLDRSRWFIEKSTLARSAIVFAGPFFNFLLAIAVFIFTFAYYGERSLEEQPIIGGVMDGSPAAAGGLLVKDRVVALNSKAISSWEELAKGIHNGDGKPITLQVQRADGEHQLTVQPEKKPVPSLTSKPEEMYLIGIEPTILRNPVSLPHALKSGVLMGFIEVRLQLAGLWGLVKGYISPKDLAGPIYIFQVAGKKAKQGAEDVLILLARLSVSLAVLNLLPIPVLDGGHLFFFLIEALIGPISIRKKEFAQQVGLVLLLLLMVFAFGNDLTRKADHLENPIRWQKLSP